MSVEAKILVFIGSVALGILLGALIEILENMPKVVIVREISLSDYSSVVEEAKRITGESSL
jgi:hypothetical protein